MNAIWKGRHLPYTFLPSGLYQVLSSSKSELQEESEEYAGINDENEIPFQDIDINSKKAKANISSQNNYAEIVTEAETSKINNYKQSAMGLTLNVPNTAASIIIQLSVGSYFEKESFYPCERKGEDGKTVIVMSEVTKRCYFRKSTDSSLEIPFSNLPTESERFISDKYILVDQNGEQIRGLGIAITYRMFDTESQSTIYTITLLNTNKASPIANIPITVSFQ